MRLRLIAVVTVIAAVLVPVQSAHAVISGTADAVTKIFPPTCVDTPCGLGNNTTNWAWDEQQGVTLASDIQVDM